MASATKSVTGVIQCREYVVGRNLDLESRADEVQVWTIDLNTHRASVLHFRSLLPAEEIARADKFRFEQGRN